MSCFRFVDKAGALRVYNFTSASAFICVGHLSLPSVYLVHRPSPISNPLCANPPPAGRDDGRRSYQCRCLSPTALLNCISTHTPLPQLFLSYMDDFYGSFVRHTAHITPWSLFLVLLQYKVLSLHPTWPSLAPTTTASITAVSYITTMHFSLLAIAAVIMGGVTASDPQQTC